MKKLSERRDLDRISLRQKSTGNWTYTNLPRRTRSARSRIYKSGMVIWDIQSPATR